MFNDKAGIRHTNGMSISCHALNLNYLLYPSSSCLDVPDVADRTIPNIKLASSPLGLRPFLIYVLAIY